MTKFDHLLVANETDIGVAEPTFVGSYKLQNQLSSIAHLKTDNEKKAPTDQKRLLQKHSHAVFDGMNSHLLLL